MFESWLAVFLGWPSAFGGAVFLFLGIIFKRPSVAALGAVLSAGFCLYLAMNPLPFRLLGLLALACNIASVFAIRRRNRLVALGLLLPFLLVSTYLVYAIRS